MLGAERIYSVLAHNIQPIMASIPARIETAPGRAPWYGGKNGSAFCQG